MTLNANSVKIFIPHLVKGTSTTQQLRFHWKLVLLTHTSDCVDLSLSLQDIHFAQCQWSISAALLLFHSQPTFEWFNCDGLQLQLRCNEATNAWCTQTHTSSPHKHTWVVQTRHRPPESLWSPPASGSAAAAPPPSVGPRWTYPCLWNDVQEMWLPRFT